jgi:hypothetical protein
MASSTLSLCLALLQTWGLLLIPSIPRIFMMRVLELNEMSSMYETTDFRALSITNFKPELIVLHRVVRKTLAPRESDSSRVPQYERNLLQTKWED